MEGLEERDSCIHDMDQLVKQLEEELKQEKMKAKMKHKKEKSRTAIEMFTHL